MTVSVRFGPRSVSAAVLAGLGGKLGIDATNKWPPETRREWGSRIRMAEEIVEKVTSKWQRYGLPGSGRSIWR